MALLPVNYALKEVAEALEDDISPSPPGSLGHTARQVSGKVKVICGVFYVNCDTIACVCHVLVHIIINIIVFIQ